MIFFYQKPGNGVRQPNLGGVDATRDSEVHDTIKAITTKTENESLFMEIPSRSLQSQTLCLLLAWYGLSNCG